MRALWKFTVKNLWVSGRGQIINVGTVWNTPFNKGFSIANMSFEWTKELPAAEPVIPKPEPLDMKEIILVKGHYIQFVYFNKGKSRLTFKYLGTINPETIKKNMDKKSQP